MSSPCTTPVGSRFLASAVLLFALGIEAFAQADFLLTDLNLSPQLTAMSGGEYAIADSQLGVSLVDSAGGDFATELAATSISAAVVPTTANTVLSIVLLDGSLVITVSETAPAGALEFTESLGNPGGWKRVVTPPSGRSYALPWIGPARFFRWGSP